MTNLATYWDSHSADIDATASLMVSQSSIVPPAKFDTVVNNYLVPNGPIFNYGASTLTILDSTENLPTDDDYARGYMNRYIFRQSNNAQDVMKETDSDGFIAMRGYFLYTPLQIRWKIIGNKEKTKQINLNIIEDAERKLPGARNYLAQNPLQYWKNIAEKTVKFDITQDLVSTQTVTSTGKPAITNIPEPNRIIDTETDIDILTQFYDDLIVEDDTYM